MHRLSRGTLQGQCAQDGDVLAPVARSVAKGPRIDRAAGVKPAHRTVDSALVHKHQVALGDARYVPGKLLAQVFDALGGRLVVFESLFLCVNPRANRARLSAEALKG